MHEHGAAKPLSSNQEDEQAQWVIERLPFLKVRNDLDFVDADHISEGSVLVHDFSQWKYHTIGELDYAILEALDDANNLQEAQNYILEEYNLELEISRIVDVLKVGLQLKLFELWIYPEPITLSKLQMFKLNTIFGTFHEKLAGTGLTPLFDQLSKDIKTKNAAKIARTLVKLKIEDPNNQIEKEQQEIFLTLYNHLIKISLPRQKIEMKLMKSRIDLFNPTLLLKILNPIIGWIHTPLGLLLALGICGFFAASTPFEQLAVIFDVRHPQADLLWRPEYTLLAAPMAWIAVFFHELFGHALALHRFGGKVPTIGILLFFLTMPAGFANVSDSYRQEKRWKRVWVDAAGLIVNLLLGLIAIGCLRFLTPGTAYYAACCFFVAANFGGMTMNLIPWIKFDGYYILSDALGQPTLQEDATRVSKKIKAKVIYGKNIDFKGLGLSRSQFIVSAVFFVGQTSMILMMLPMMFMFMLPRLTYSLGVGGLFLFAIFLVVRLLRFKPDKNNTTQQKAEGFPWKLWLKPPRSIIMGTIFFLFFFFPLKLSQEYPIELKAQKSEIIQSEFIGTVENVYVKDGQKVTNGQPILKLKSPNFDLEINKAKAQLKMLQAQFNMLKNGATEKERKIISLTMQQSKTIANNQNKLIKKMNDSDIFSQSERNAQSQQLTQQLRLLNAQLIESEKSKGEKKEIVKAFQEVVRSQKNYVNELIAQKEKYIIKASFNGIVTLIQQNAEISQSEINNNTIPLETYIGKPVNKGEFLAMLIGDNSVIPTATIPPNAPVHEFDFNAKAKILIKSQPEKLFNLNFNEAMHNEIEGKNSYQIKFSEISTKNNIAYLPGVSGNTKIPLKSTSCGGLIYKAVILPVIHLVKDVI